LKTTAEVKRAPAKPTPWIWIDLNAPTRYIERCERVYDAAAPALLLSSLLSTQVPWRRKDMT
jgi:hypothetical protein